jgi:putative ABC transport system permease protein
MGMFRNYFRTTLRNLWKNKIYSFLNIFGLAIGIACAGLIFLWVEDEVNYDASFIKKDWLYMIRTNQTFDGKTRTFDSSPGLLAASLKSDIPGISNTCRFSWNRTPLFTLGEKSVNESGFYVDSTFFSMFAPTFIQGDPKNAVKDLYSIVISEKMSNHFFGNNRQILGKTIRANNTQDYVITGVIKDIPENSTLKFDWIAPFEIFHKQNDWLKYWAANGVKTFVELIPTTNPTAINKQINGFIAKKSADAKSARPILFGMNDWHLRDHFEDGKHLAGGRITYVHMFSGIAWIILLIACINFMNLATARSEKRAREVGVRKVLGAERKMLTLQFIAEALFLALLALVFALGIMALALPVFNPLVEKKLTIGLDNPLHVGALLIIGFFCGLISGSYPALYLSSLNPVAVLKSFRLKGGSASLIRKGLVIFQFAISIVLIICTIIVYQQIQHIKSRDLGYNKNNLIQIYLSGEMLKHYPAIRQDLLNTGAVGNVGLSSSEILYTSDNTTGYSWQGKDPVKSILISYREISPGFIDTWGMHITDGRDFQPNADADSLNVLITASFAKLMGKESAVGKIISDDNNHFQVVGIVKDLVYGDMYGKSDPVIFFCAPAQTSILFIRTKPTTSPEEALTTIGAVMKKDNPAYPFVYKFVDDEFNEFFKSEVLIGKLSRIFALLAVIISCMGLFGLTAFTAEIRTREIGIRKVLGASVTGITGLLSTDFLKLVLISTVLAFPIAGATMHNWLQNYAYRIGINWWVFAMAGLIALLIAMATISFHAIRAALANPVKSLRTE